MIKLTSDQIETRLSNLLEDDNAGWIQIGAVLTAVKEGKHWNKGFSSFSKWLEAWGKKVHLGKATLWRYITAQEKYRRLRKNALMYDYIFPPIEQLKCPISPEGIEIFDKLSRVLEEREVYEMMKGFINGEVTRKELRDKWNIYKPVMDGKTARGLPGTTMLKIEQPSKKEKGVIIESTIMDALRISESKWLYNNKTNPQEHVKSKLEPFFYKFFQNVRIPNAHRNKSVLDITLAFQKHSNSPLFIHGIEVVSKGLKNKSEQISNYRKFCNVFWVAIPEDIAEESMNYVPNGVGLLTVKNKTVKVLIEAEIDDSPELLINTLKVLLTRWKTA